MSRFSAFWKRCAINDIFISLTPIQKQWKKTPFWKQRLPLAVLCFWISHGDFGILSFYKYYSQWLAIKQRKKTKALQPQNNNPNTNKSFPLFICSVGKTKVSPLSPVSGIRQSSFRFLRMLPRVYWFT